MASRRACKICKRIYEGDKCPECGSQEHTEDFKGRIMVLDAEKSEVAQKVKIKKAGMYAIKSK